MWHNYSFSQRNKAAERAVRVGVGGDKKRGRANKEESS